MTDIVERYYIDCEFDGHRGELLSIALVREDGDGIYITTTAEARDEWVLANVVPLLDKHECKKTVRCLPDEVGAVIKAYISGDHPTIVADSPVDIYRFCDAVSTGPCGDWTSAEYPRMTFEVLNVDCYPTDLAGAVQHNAWWDAMALRRKAADTFEQLRARIAELEGCLEPFAKMGEMANFAFAPALFSDRDSIKELPWSENGEPVTITYGDLRRAAAIRERTDGR